MRSRSVVARNEAEKIIAQQTAEARDRALAQLGYTNPAVFNYNTRSRLYTVAYDAIKSARTINAVMCLDKACEAVTEFIKRNPKVLQPAERFKPVVSSFENAGRL